MRTWDGSAAAAGELLARTGYVADGVQSAQTLHAIKDMMLRAPLIGGMIAGALIAFYPISRRVHAIAAPKGNGRADRV